MRFCGYSGPYSGPDVLTSGASDPAVVSIARPTTAPCRSSRGPLPYSAPRRVGRRPWRNWRPAPVFPSRPCIASVPPSSRSATCTSSASPADASSAALPAAGGHRTSRPADGARAVPGAASHATSTRRSTSRCWTGAMCSSSRSTRRRGGSSWRSRGSGPTSPRTAWPAARSFSRSCLTTICAAACRRV